MNPLFDIEFLKNLTEYPHREIFARITALTMDELPVEYIEGKVTGGSVNIDGASAVRRTCNLTMVATDVNINEFYWGFKRKFILEVGLNNEINPDYPDIIWFKQGLFIITSFNVSQTTNNFTITINGKDKMCLLNGDISGSLPHSTDFGRLEEYDSRTGSITYTEIPIKDIIYEAVVAFGNESPSNIIINDLEEAGLELLEYRGNAPMYMIKKIGEESNSFTQMTFNGEQVCYIVKSNGVYEEATFANDRIIYENLIDLSTAEQKPTIISMDKKEPYYNVVKFEYGHTSGYRLTDLTYPGELVANIGESLTSILDKIKNVLGNFEYFYNIDGKFVFQKKKNYLQTTWSVGESNPQIKVDNAINTSFPIYSFMNSQLITSFSNNPNLLNVRNDFSVWGKYKTISGSEVPIHARLALDRKPTKYVSPYQNKTYTIKEWDWRELIYQMALDWRKHNHDDDFQVQIARYNPQWETGKTGYEQYYIDLEGFWRQLYNPNPDMKIIDISFEEINNAEYLLIKNPYRKYDAERDKDIIPSDLYYFDSGVIYPALKSKLFSLKSGVNYYYLSSAKEYVGTADKVLLSNLSLDQLFELVENEYLPYINYRFNEIKKDASNLYVKDKGYKTLEEIDDDVSSLYWNNKNFIRNNFYNKLNNFGEIIENSESLILTNYYAEGFYEYNKDTYWANKITEAPETLFFWFDFLETEEGDLEKFSVPVIGSRTKTINDNNVKTIYYREIPTTIFHIPQEDNKYNYETGYTYIQIPKEMESLFSISSKGKSAQERLDELLQTHSYCIENATIQTVPVYHLEPNTRIYVRDDKSGLDGEYIVSKMSIPLTYNGTMSLTTTKVITNII